MHRDIQNAIDIEDRDFESLIEITAHVTHILSVFGACERFHYHNLFRKKKIFLSYQIDG